MSAGTYFKPGDLLRMCSVSEMHNRAPALIDWCYGIYIDTIEEIHSYDGFSDCSEQYDRILHNGRILKADHFWHIERVS